jgi:branched-chain amino acid transport system substrate-binding protein
VRFVQKFRKRFGQTPTYTAGTYEAIVVLEDAIEKAGTLDADKLVNGLEKHDGQGTAGRLVFDETHDATFGPGYTTGLGVQ